jgi:hypothetical protein
MVALRVEQDELFGGENSPVRRTHSGHGRAGARSRMIATPRYRGLQGPRLRTPRLPRAHPGCRRCASRRGPRLSSHRCEYVRNRRLSSSLLSASCACCRWPRRPVCQPWVRHPRLTDRDVREVVAGCRLRAACPGRPEHGLSVWLALPSAPALLLTQPVVRHAAGARSVHVSWCLGPHWSTRTQPAKPRHLSRFCPADERRPRHLHSESE